MVDPVTLAAAPFWFVVGLALRAVVDDYVHNHAVRHTHRKRARGER